MNLIPQATETKTYFIMPCMNEIYMKKYWKKEIYLRHGTDPSFAQLNTGGIWFINGKKMKTHSFQVRLFKDRFVPNQVI